MSNCDDSPALESAYRHPTVYRTVRGLALSGGRAGVASGPNAAGTLPPLRSSEKYQVRRGVGRVDPAPAHDDAAGLFDAVRYSEPND